MSVLFSLILCLKLCVTVASRCFPKAITDIVVTDANNKTISQAKLQQGVEFVTYVHLFGIRLCEFLYLLPVKLLFYVCVWLLR